VSRTGMKLNSHARWMNVLAMSAALVTNKIQCKYCVNSADDRLHEGIE